MSDGSVRPVTTEVRFAVVVGGQRVGDYPSFTEARVAAEPVGGTIETFRVRHYRDGSTD